MTHVKRNVVRRVIAVMAVACGVLATNLSPSAAHNTGTGLNVHCTFLTENHKGAGTIRDAWTHNLDYDCSGSGVDSEAGSGTWVYSVGSFTTAFDGVDNSAAKSRHRGCTGYFPGPVDCTTGENSLGYSN